MSLGIGPIGQTYTAAGVPARTPQPLPETEPTGPTGRFGGVDRVELSAGTMPDELHAEIDAAYQRTLDLRTQNRELHFSTDDETGRIVVQVRDLDGHVLRNIPNLAALDVMAGADID